MPLTWYVQFILSRVYRLITIPPSKDEVTLAGYYKHKSVFAAPAPLTMREEEMIEIKRAEVNTHITTDTRQQTMSGISIPLTVSASNGIKDMARGSYNYLQFNIELQAEQVNLVKAANVELDRLPKEIPSDTARYVMPNSFLVHLEVYIQFSALDIICTYSNTPMKVTI